MAKFQQTSTAVEYQPFTVGASIYRNVTALFGTGNRERIIVGAHYDTVAGSPGADDNGVAVAGLLEFARALAEHPTDDTIELVAWDLEEPQTLLTGFYRPELSRLDADEVLFCTGFLVCTPEDIGTLEGTNWLSPADLMATVGTRLRHWVHGGEDDAPVVRSAVRETTALGAAYAAGLAVGFWNGEHELREQWQAISPEQRETMRKRWREMTPEERDRAGDRTEDKRD